MISHHDSGHANCYFVATLWHSPTFPANWDYVILLQNVSTRRSLGYFARIGSLPKRWLAYSVGQAWSSLGAFVFMNIPI